MARITNPIQFVSRTFNTILTDINSDPELADKPNWWKRIWAGVGDVLNLMLNATANNVLLRTSFTRQNTADLLALIDYELTEQTTASGELLFFLAAGVSFPKTILLADLVGFTPGSLAVSAKRFEARAAVTITSQVTEVVADTAVTPATDQITVARVFTTGEKCRVSAATSLPTPLAIDTDYWAIKVSSTEIRLATSLVNAYSGTQIDITAQGVGNLTIALFSQGITAFQQETKPTQTVGVSDGVTEFQEFAMPDADILKDTLVITINSDVWTRVDTLVFSQPTDKHFRLLYNTDNTSRLQFGNDTYGAIPAAFDIEADYAVGGNTESNVSTIDRINIYGGSDSDISGVSNPAALTGGADPQSVALGKVLGPLLLKARDRFVTSEDAEALALDFGGFSQIKVNSNEFGLLSVQVIGIANGGGNPSSALKTSLQTHLIERSILESIDVRVQDTTITDVAVTSAAKVLPGFTFANVEPFFELAWLLFLSETGLEIQDKFEADGISEAVDLINTIFSKNFGSDDFDQIQRLVENLDPRLIGESVQESSALGYIDSFVNGVDYITITVPAFPITVADDEITSDGTLTLSEIS